MEDKHKLSQFLSEHLGGIPPRNIHNALCKWEQHTEKMTSKERE